ncbi:succinylglutamate desuccinylase/aspartoacylase family protein [Achromobacter denitrificans]
MPARNGERSTYFTDIDFDRPGKQSGFVYFPHSPHDDAWGTVRVPLAVISNGAGPTILLEGGNHGDEYEGPIALGELIRALDPQSVQGRLIIIPAINAPAVDAGRRTSPIDGKNMNRVFPGDHAGTITEQIAAFVNDELLPRADALLSLHSGGSSLNIVPSTIVIPCPDEKQFQRCLDAAHAFGAPMCVVMDNLGDRRLCVTAAMAAGLTCVSTEMAGGGVVTPSALDLCRQGMRRVLRLWGVLAGDEAPSAASSRTQPYFEMRGAKAYVIASEHGIFEPRAVAGAQVEQGEVAGRIHFLTAPGKEPVTLYFQEPGIVYSTRQYGIVRPGNTCAVVASPQSGHFA